MIPAAEGSDSADAWIDLYSDWNALLGYMSSERGRIAYRFWQKMDDPEREEADRYMSENVLPVVFEAEHRLVGAFIESRHRNALAGHYGEQLLHLHRHSLESIAPVNNDLRLEEEKLSRRYGKLMGMGRVKVNGEEMTLGRAGSLRESDDPEMRRSIYAIVNDWVLEHREEMGEIYDGLVKLRHRMALNVGFENYIQLGYQQLGRIEYGPGEVATFRESVRRYAVPLRNALIEQQRRILGTPAMKAWDTIYDPGVMIPYGVVRAGTLLDDAQKMFDALSPRLGGHFARMRELGLIDLENRTAKRPGALCMYFHDQGHPAILCNSTGSADDVRGLIHEMGHAFQAWESNGIEILALHSPTPEASEMHSIGMEYLTLPHIGIFFDEENTNRFRRGRWKTSVVAMCYRSLVDEFQHWVYANPEATPAERDEEWRRLSRIYEPGIDYEGIEQYDGLRWYLQQHIFLAPFYYIDYGIAEMGAMQLALIDAEDHDRAMETYLKLCRIGGTRGVLDIFEGAGLRSPFELELMRDLMGIAAKRLGCG